MTGDAAAHDKIDRHGDATVRDGSTRLRIQAQVSQAFANTVTDYRRLIETIVRTVADLLGDGCQIFLVSDDGRALVNAGNAHRDAALEADVRNFLAGPPQPLATSQMITADVVRRGEPRLIAEIDPDAVRARTAPRPSSSCCRGCGSTARRSHRSARGAP